MKKNILKYLTSTFLAATIILECFLLPTFAISKEEVFVYIRHNGDKIEYMIDSVGNKYIYENGEKVYIAIPTQTSIVSVDTINRIMRTANEIDYETLPYSKTMNVGTGEFTDVIKLFARQYVYLKCSNYSPLFADKGMSYYIFYSYDGNEWVSELYVNQTLTFKTKHFVYDSGYPYMKIRMWSYAASVSTCVLDIT